MDSSWSLYTVTQIRFMISSVYMKSLCKEIILVNVVGLD